VRRPKANQLPHHSDRGCQYTSDDYQQTLRALGIECSMSHAGSCYDNAAMERFFWSLKLEWTNHESFADEAAARLSVFKYIQTFYNSVRLHKTLGTIPQPIRSRPRLGICGVNNAPPLSESHGLTQCACGTSVLG
jgi:putative transposase